LQRQRHSNTLHRDNLRFSARGCLPCPPAPGRVHRTHWLVRHLGEGVPLMHSGARYGTAIVGSGHCVPGRVLSNENLMTLVDTSDEWIVARTGVRERRIAQNEENSGTLALE